MVNRSLKNKPLLEAILEIKWALSPHSENIGNGTDPHYKILLGRMFDKISGPEGLYPIHEELPAARIPDEFAGHIVQHRFMVKAGDWPLMQLGPGILTLNETGNYTWEDFKNRANLAVEKLCASHPNPKELTVENITLRYVNALEFDFLTNDALQFLQDKMQVNIVFPEPLFDHTGVSSKPDALNIFSTFKCSNPNGEISIRLGTGFHENRKHLIWELFFVSGNAFEGFPGSFEEWLTGAHQILEDWFFKLIAGELEGGFGIE